MSFASLLSLRIDLVFYVYAYLKGRIVKRQSDRNIDPVFLERWSPRAFSDENISMEDVLTILEAGRWAPSCYNEQPWRFAIAVTDRQKKTFSETLVKQNQIWASQSAALVYIVYKSTFSFNGEENKWAFFDAGAAWASMAIQATKMGLHVHAMAGFNAEKARKLLKLGDDFSVAVAVAIGKLGDRGTLPDSLKEMECPSDRKPLDELII